MLFQRDEPSRVLGGRVRFEPGARTARHTHPFGQTLIATEGVGWTRVEGGPVMEIHAGDMLLYRVRERRHWHTDIAVQESENGPPVTWTEQVSDEDYQKGPDR